MYKIKFKDGTVKEFKSLIRADLRNANLYNADLYNADLRNANLENCKGIISFTGEKHILIMYKFNNEHRIKIGCQDHTIDYWLENVANIGKENGYNKDEILLYKTIIKTLSNFEIEG